MIFRVNSINKSFGNHRVLSDVSFDLTEPGITGLLGKNGVGKTTLLRILAGISHADSGEVSLDNLPVTDVGYKSRVSYLSEKNPLYPNQYVREYLEWISEVYDRKPATSELDDLMDSLGLMEVAGQKIGKLSKGFRQRIGLAAAIVPDPEILILDEPVNGLDPAQILQYRKVLKDLAKTKVVLLSSHLLQEVEALCDRLMLMDQGELKLDGAMEDIATMTGHSETRVTLNRTMDRNSLASQDWVEKIVKSSEYTWDIRPVKGKDIRAKIFDWAVENDLKILEMTAVDDGLSELFKS